MKEIAATIWVNKWVVWTDFSDTGTPLAGVIFYHREDAQRYADETGGRMEYIGQVYTA